MREKGPLCAIYSQTPDCYHNFLLGVSEGEQIFRFTMKSVWVHMDEEGREIDATRR